MKTRLYFAKRKKLMIRHSYVRRIQHSLEDHSFWGIRLEVLFRGFSLSEMFRIESEIRDLIHRKKKAALESGELKEVVLNNLITKPFKDEVV